MDRADTQQAEQPLGVARAVYFEQPACIFANVGVLL